MSGLRIALAQINLTVGDFEGNKKKILDYLRRAKDSGAEIIAFPPMAVCGYPPGDLVRRPSFLRCCRGALKNITEKVKGITAIVGFADREQGAVLGAAAVLHQGKVAGVAGGDAACPVFSRGDAVFAIEIGNEKKSVPQMFPGIAGGPEIIFYLSARPYYPGVTEIREKFLAARAEENLSVIAGNNLVGGQDELVFPGGSLVLDHRGEPIAQGRMFAEDLLIVDTDLTAVREARRRSKLSGDRLRKPVSPEKKTALIRLSRPGRSRRRLPPAVQRVRTKKLGRCGEIYQALVLGTRDYVRKNGFARVILGLSAGIDSSLTACVAVDALGSENVVGLLLPARYTSKRTLRDAERLAENLNLRLITISIDGLFQSYLDILQPEFGGRKADATEENLQARIRGNILMAFANKFGWLVLATGNKSEMSTGYCTLYGDMVGGFAVLKDIPKLMVYELAAYRNRCGPGKVIPDSIIRRVPTAELSPGQRDEDSLPPYPILDPILDAYVNQGKDYREIAASGYPPGVVKKVIRLWSRAEFKRRQAPPGIRISPGAL